MDDITKKLLDHEASTVRGSLPAYQASAEEVHRNTHATRAHLMRLGVCHLAFVEGRIASAMTIFGMVVDRLTHCRLPPQLRTAYVHALHINAFPAVSISDEIVAHIGVLGAQQLDRMGRFALGEIRECLLPDSDLWPILAFLMEFMRSAIPNHG
jgi:hypothetical protein